MNPATKKGSNTGGRKGKPRPKVTKKNRMRLYTLAGIAAIAVLVFAAIMLANRGQEELPLPPEGGDTTPTQVTLQNQVIQNLIANMVYVEGGTFTMGATAEQGSDVENDEKPAHQVTLSSFSIGKYEVTQAEWLAVMGSNPSHFTGDSRRPVENVSWNDCQEFVRKLNAMTGKRFRLPTEAEWEFAARGGNRSRGYKYAGSNTLGNVAWYHNNRTHPVGTKSPNELGLYDMSGNVWELCQDRYGSYSSNSQYNPTGPTSGSDRVSRGGCWNFYVSGCRVSLRRSHSPSGALTDLGLRLAL